MKRVVITGLGIISPLGRGATSNWKGLLGGKSAISKITRFDTSDFTCKIAGEVKQGTEAGDFNPDEVMDLKDRRRVDTFILYAMCAGGDAIKDAGLLDLSEEEKENIGVLIGSGIGGLCTIAETSITLHEHGPRRVSPFFIPSVISNMASGNISIKYGFKGPNSTVTTACATSTHAIGDAAAMIRLGSADIMVAGGAEAPLSPLALAGFCQARALSTAYNDTPELACRPWDKARDGFVMSEGSGIVILEEYEHAKKRGAKIYAEVSGYGMSGDAYHITAPDPQGRGAIKAMQKAITNANLNLEDIGYINAHGTSTGAGDISEATAIKTLFANHLDTVSMSSTKSATGHLLGAAGGVEAIYSIMALQNGILPPTLNLNDVADEAAGIDLVPNTPKEKKITHALSNSFGFGGTNATLLFSKV